jgi:2-polyprenyl-3-methyl-5-hydroxy-6-metoxy-1,4-benzoquinol methylase
MIKESKALEWDKRHITGNYEYCSYARNHIPVLNAINQFKCKSILDVGCYTGALGTIIPENGLIESYHGIDISDIALSEAKKNCMGMSKCSFEIADLEDYNSDKEFDCIVFSGIFTYPQYSDHLALQYVKKFNPDYIIVQDVVRKRELYPKLKTKYRVIHKSHYRINERAQRDHRQLYVFEI